MNKIIRNIVLASSLGIASGLYAATPANAQTPAPGVLVSLFEQRLASNLAALKKDIELTSAQKQQFDQCMKQMQLLKTVATNSAFTMKRTIDDELGKAQPDLGRIATTGDSVQAQMIASRQAVRAEWLKLYAMLTPEQQSAVGNHLRKKWQRFESVVEFLRDFAPAAGTQN